MYSIKYFVVERGAYADITNDGGEEEIDITP